MQKVFYARLLAEEARNFMSEAVSSEVGIGQLCELSRVFLFATHYESHCDMATLSECNSYAPG